MKKIILYSLLGVFTLLLVNSCKRGPKDPFFSFSSRKSRMIGKWKVTSIMVNDTEFQTRVLNTKIAAPPCGDKTTAVTTTQDIVLEFDDKGNYTRNYTRKINVAQSFSIVNATCVNTSTDLPDSVHISKGRWFFIGGTEDLKYKEGIAVLDIDSGLTENYDIIQLKSKQTILEVWDLFGGSLGKVDLTLEPVK